MWPGWPEDPNRPPPSGSQPRRGRSGSVVPGAGGITTSSAATGSIGAANTVLMDLGTQGFNEVLGPFFGDPHLGDLQRRWPREVDSLTGAHASRRSRSHGRRGGGKHGDNRSASPSRGSEIASQRVIGDRELDDEHWAAFNADARTIDWSILDVTSDASTSRRSRSHQELGFGRRRDMRSVSPRGFIEEIDDDDDDDAGALVHAPRTAPRTTPERTPRTTLEKLMIQLRRREGIADSESPDVWRCDWNTCGVIIRRRPEASQEEFDASKEAHREEHPIFLPLPPPLSDAEIEAHSMMSSHWVCDYSDDQGVCRMRIARHQYHNIRQHVATHYPLNMCCVVCYNANSALKKFTTYHAFMSHWRGKHLDLEFDPPEASDAQCFLVKYNKVVVPISPAQAKEECRTSVVNPPRLATHPAR